MDAGTDQSPQGPATFDLDVMLRFAHQCVTELAATREEIDALNVYPVPDGDTGTNMYLTVESARDALVEAVVASPGDLGAGLKAYTRGALLGARGNSGVILSQLIGALMRHLGSARRDERTAEVFAAGMQVATEAAYAAVGTPVEGTVLSVARAASEAARAAADDPDARLATVLTAAAEAARVALARTPEQLQVLRDAGVVDAGGRGLCVVLDAAEATLTGRRQAKPSLRVGMPALPVPLPSDDLTEDGPAYEVMYLLEADDAAIPGLRAGLAPLGDSLVVVGGDGLWNVHVHVDDVGEAIEVGIRTGTPRRIRVTHFAEQMARAREKRSERRGRALVALAAGPGLVALFAEAGARVIEGGPGRRASTGDILAAIEATGAQEVVVLPNDPDTVAAAEAAARAAEESGEVHVVVVPTQAQVQGIAAIAVHEPSRPLENDVVQMAAAARGARHGAVTVAAREAMTTAGACVVGDVLGVVQGDFALIGQDRLDVATGVLERLLGGGGELVTLVRGEDCGDLAERCEDWVERTHAGIDVVIYEGGQGRYPLLMAVE